MKYFIKNKDQIKANKNLEELNLPVLYKEKLDPTLEELTPTIKSSYNRFNGKKYKKYNSRYNNKN